MNLTSVAHHLTLLELPPELDQAMQFGRCTSPRTLHELNRLHAETPEAVTALVASGAEITRTSAAALREAVGSAQAAARALTVRRPAGPHNASVLRSGKGECIVASPSRHRVTIDLRGTEERLQAFAAARHLTIAASVRRAIDSMLAGEGEADNGEHLIMESTAKEPVVKVTLRLPPAPARLIAIRALRADVSQGEYVAGLVEGTPPTPLMPRHGEVVAEFSRSTSIMAALGVDLNHVASLMRSGATTNSEQHRANYELLRDVVREHVVLASRLIADVKSTGRVRLLDRNRRSG